MHLDKFQILGLFPRKSSEMQSRFWFCKDVCYSITYKSKILETIWVFKFWEMVKFFFFLVYSLSYVQISFINKYLNTENVNNMLNESFVYEILKTEV